MKKRNYYFILGIYGILFLILLVGFKHLFGSNIDWITQHVTIPEYFRNLFYETKNLIPNLAFNLGAGQNIYNFSYYGLLSPIILLSYLLPFVNMPTFIMIASVILYLLSGFLMFKFIDENFHNNKLSLLSGLIILSVAPITYHFHHHIMFVWYIPFLILSLIGVDRYFLKKKSFLLMTSVFLLIMTNYYYAVSSLLVITLYIIYKLIDLNKFNFKNILKIFMRIIIPIAMASIIILPTLYTIKNGQRSFSEIIKLKNVIFPNLREIFYGSFSLGITGIFLVFIVGNLCIKKQKRSEIFLNTALILIISLPIICFFLNGFLYIRGKVLIPFIVLFIFAYISFFVNFYEKKVDYKKMIKITFILLLFYLIGNYKNFIYIIEILIWLFILTKFKTKITKQTIAMFTLIILIISSVTSSFKENYFLVSNYKNLNANSKEINHLYSNINDDNFYRSVNNYESEHSINKVYNQNFYSPSIYSSTFNKYYLNFYNNQFGNNIKYRNLLMTAGTNNDFFNTYMGVKYITDKNYKSLYYKKIDSYHGINLYYNKNAYPIIYAANNLGSIKEYKKLKFPYNVEYLMNNTIITNNKTNTQNKTIIKSLKEDYQKNYNLNLKENKIYQLKIPEHLFNKYLYISFDIKNNLNCPNGDVFIKINGIKNKLTCKDWKYYNKNNKFEYVIPINYKNSKLNIKLSKGNYKIKNVKVYYSDILKNNYKELNNLKIDKKNSTISGNVNLDKDNYLVTSIPYDKGFKIYVNNKLTKTEIVNTSFLGAKLKKGKNNITIKYVSPYFNIGLIISFIGLILYISVILYERKSKNI